ncbi:MAG: cytochrome P450 [Pseudomonadota bacterium]
MADTAQKIDHGLERPETKRREPMYPRYMTVGSEIPPASEIDLDTLDMIDPELWRQGKMWDRFERLRNEAPIHRCPESAFGHYWSITRYEDILKVDTDHKRFSSSWEHGGITLGDVETDIELPMFIAMDEPRHAEQRKTVQPAVAPDMLKIYEPLIRQRTKQCLDAAPVGEPFDWVDTVSIELTTMMLATLFDFPFEERRRLTRWSDVTTGPHDPDICPGGEEQWLAELMECYNAFNDIFQERRNQPRKNDLISLLAHGEKTRDMGPQELLGNMLLLIVGGNDTTRSTMTASVYGLNKFPEEYAKLKADPGLIPNMVSETIRWQTPLAHMRRTALEDVEMHGQLIKAGDPVAMWYISGNRDERFWKEDPNRLIIDRAQARNHLSFGFGIHRCVGNRLAELQLRILWEEIMERFSHIEVLEEPVSGSGMFVNGYRWMPVICHPKT